MDSKQDIEAIFQHANEGILLTNEKNDILHINPSAEKIFGYAQEELIGKKIENLIPERFKKIEKKEILKKIHSKAAVLNFFGVKKDGSEFPLEMRLSPFSSTKGNFVVNFIVDLTSKIKSEQHLKNYSSDVEKQVNDRTIILQEVIAELEKTKNELHQALKKEKELNEMKSRFVSMASHEFRTPLATIMSSLTLVKAYGDKNDSINQNKHIQKIKGAISNLTDILDDFLSVSKLEEGKIELQNSHFDITFFINEIIAEVESLCKEGQSIKHFHTGENDVFLDKKLLRNILFNLISNASKFSKINSKIIIKTQKNDSEFTLLIEDKGIGISEKDQKNLFERFFRAKNAVNINGTGLGLNIIKNYVELMHGSIKFKSKENIGTTFNLTFPLKQNQKNQNLKR